MTSFPSFLEQPGSSKSIDDLRKLLKQVNEQSRKIQKELENRRSICQKIKEEIKQIDSASVADHQRYKSIVEENKKLVTQFKELDKKRLSIVEERNRALEEIEREKERVCHESKEAIEIEERIKQLRLQHDLNRASEAKYEEILQAAKEQDLAQDVALKQEQENIASLTEKIGMEKALVKNQQKQLEEVKDYNAKIMRYVDVTSYQMVEEHRDDGKRHWPSNAPYY